MRLRLEELWQARASAPEYARRVGRHWWFLLAFAVSTIVGTIQTFATTFTLPWWAWYALAVVFLAIAQFLAFDEVRRERDAAIATPDFPDVSVHLWDVTLDDPVDSPRGPVRRVLVKVEIRNRSEGAVSIRCSFIVHNDADSFAFWWAQREAPFQVEPRSVVQVDFHVAAGVHELELFALAGQPVPHPTNIAIEAHELLTDTRRRFDAKPSP